MKFHCNIETKKKGREGNGAPLLTTMISNPVTNMLIPYTICLVIIIGRYTWFKIPWNLITFRCVTIIDLSRFRLPCSIDWHTIRRTTFKYSIKIKPIVKNSMSVTTWANPVTNVSVQIMKKIVSYVGDFRMSKKKLERNRKLA